MSSEMEAIDKAKEAAEEGRERKHLAPVSLTMAILAVMVATVSLLGHRAHTEEILLQTRATDQWAYYQAKNIRRNNLEALDDVLTALENTKEERAQEVQKRFHDEIDKYRDQQKTSRTKRAAWRRKWDAPAAAPTASTWARYFWRSRWSSLPLPCSRTSAPTGTSDVCWRR